MTTLKDKAHKILRYANRFYDEEDIAKAIKELKEIVEYLQKDCATLDICDKDDVIKAIDKIFGDFDG